MYAFDNQYKSESRKIIAGIDEAGRGPLAGPVVAAAVILPEELIDGLNDSKKISEKKRESLFEVIQQKAIVGVGILPEKVIDKLNIYHATKLAMLHAVEKLSTRPDFILIDGNMGIDSEINHEPVVKGDSKSASIAAASIIAKVTRDRIMYELHEKYPDYGFDKHKGYPTKVHIESLKEFGASPVHRRSYGPVKKVLEAR